MSKNVYDQGTTYQADANAQPMAYVDHSDSGPLANAIRKYLAIVDHKKTKGITTPINFQKNTIKEGNVYKYSKAPVHAHEPVDSDADVETAGVTFHVSEE